MGLLVTTRKSAITRGPARNRCHAAIPQTRAPRRRAACEFVPGVPPTPLWWQSVEVPDGLWADFPGRFPDRPGTTGAERRQMKAKTEARLTPRERLTRGLTYSLAGPVYVTRGVAGLGVDAAHASAVGLRRRYREGRLARDVATAQEALGQELAAAQEVAANLPQSLRDARRAQRRRNKRPLLIAGAAVTVLAGGAVVFSVVRRSTRARPQEPSPRPPSVDVQPRP